MADEELLKKKYLDPASKTAFRGATPLIRELREKNSKKKINEWLQSEDTFTLHRPVRQKFPRSHYNVINRDHLFEIDLADM